MATKHWLGTADAVAQIASGSVDTYDAATSYIVTIGGDTVSVAGNTDVATTAGDLVTALNASTNPYFSEVTWTNPSGGTVTGTADNAGVPFTATLTVSGGTGTVTNLSDSTASSGPNDWSTADNWSDGAVPASTDTVIFRDSAVSVYWGIDQNAVDLAELSIEKTYTGKIGLNRAKFGTGAAGETESDAKAEYREDYLIIGADTIRIGQQFGPTTANGSQRIKIDNDKAGASELFVYGTASSASESGLPAVRYLASHANADAYIRSAPGGFGIAVDVPGETATVGVVSISDQTTTSRVHVGDGTTITTYKQTGGTNFLQAAATVTTATVEGGTLTTEGDFLVTTVNANGGTLNANNAAASGNSITTLNIDGGKVDALGSSEARTWGTVNHEAGQLLATDDVTITTYNEPASGEYSVTVA